MSERFWEGTGQEPEIAGGHRAGCGSSRRHRAGQQGARHRRAAAWEALGWHRVPGMGSQHPPGSVSPVPYLPQQADWRGDERGNPSPSTLRSAQSGENLSLPGKSHFCTLELPNSRFQHPPNPKRSHMGTPYGDTRDSDVSPQFTLCVALRGKNPFVFPCLLVLHSHPSWF